MNTKLSTLTTRVAAIEMKMLYLQYRAIKIIKDQKTLESVQISNNRERIKQGRDSVFNTVDIIITMEYIAGLINDLLATPELRDKFDENMYKLLNRSKKAAVRWRSVRNHIGGHLNIEAIEGICIKYNFKGVFLSKDLDCDAAVLNMLMIQGAINQARKTEDIFGRDINLLKDAQIFNQQIDSDWEVALEFFEPTLKFLYDFGKDEKKANTSPSTWDGIVSDD
jgi:hypothetical protein